jgi:hypothetical protein
LDELGDAVRLFDPETNLVDQFYFDVTQRGFTFTYDTDCGAAVQSELGVHGAFQAAACKDVGSPGWATNGPVPLRITQQPLSQTVDAGNDVTFRVEACGLPRPRGYQWYFNGIALPSATAVDAIPTLVNYAGCGLAWKVLPKATDLFIPNVQPAHAGQYFVVMTNGLERLTSAVVTLTVNTNPMPPRIECPPLDWRFSGVPGQSETNLTIFENQTAIFEVVARGYPLPTFRWSRITADGTRITDLPGATNSTLMITLALPGHSGIYRVRVQNTNGTVFAYAQLTVKPAEERPQLRVTEAMSEECFTEANDWWELTNIGDEPVNLYGYRWDNAPGNIGGGPTITNALIIQPGESVIFLEGRAPEFFTTWWGASNLPSGLRFITYTANGLDARGSEEINVWNPTAGDDGDWLDQGLFTGAARGFSFWFDTETCVASSVLSLTNAVGHCGAFRSVQGCDVGSPGWTRWTPPHLTSIRRDGSQVWLEWKAQPGSTTEVQYARELAPSGGETDWVPLGNYSFAGASCVTNDPTLGADQQRFYRVMMTASAPCDCPEFDFDD